MKSKLNLCDFIGVNPIRHIRPFMLSTVILSSMIHPVTSIAGNLFKNIDYRGTTMAVQQQTVSVKGWVKDTAGEAVIGASVKEKGKNNGVITDINGYFVLNISPQAILQISYIGYASQEINVNGKRELTITLQEDNNLLDEVVVVGFGTQKKVNLTGSVSVLEEKALEARPVNNALQALQGQMPGLNISVGDKGGLSNHGMSINVRGIGTIGEGSTASPLVLIDGMDGDINMLNPQDIASISVLKDAASSSIYGSRAPFGVIMITTKKAKEGKVSISYNNSFRWSKPLSVPEMASSYDFVSYYNDVTGNAGKGPVFDQEMVDLVRDYYEGKISTVCSFTKGDKWNIDRTNANVDWWKEYYKEQSFSQEHNVNMTGGTEKANYYISLNYLEQDGFLRYGEDDNSRLSLSAKISSKINKYIKLDFTSRFVRRTDKLPTHFSDGGVMSALTWRTRPIRPIYDDNGYLFSDVNYISAFRDGGTQTWKKNILTEQAKITVTPLKGWEIVGETNFRYGYNDDKTIKKQTYSHDKNGKEYISTLGWKNSEVNEYHKKSSFVNLNLYTSYDRTFANDHHVKILLGTQNERYRYDEFSAGRKDMIVEDLPVLDLTTGSDPTIAGKAANWSTMGFFGRINYDYQGKYLIEGNLRYDGSSRFRKEDRWIWLPSVSVGWNIAKENFFRPLAPYIQTLKPRLSYGELGNQNTSNWYPTYLTIPVKSANGSWLVDGKKPNTASAPSKLISENMTWEKIRVWNAGLDVAALDGRLTAGFDYYVRFTDDMIGPAPTLPVTLGIDPPTINNTNLKTFGFDLELSWRDRIKDFSYGVRFVLSDSRTKILKYPNEVQDITKSYIAGQYTGNIWGYTTIGIAKSQEEMDNHLATLPNGGQTALGSGWGEGDIMFKDINQDGKISEGANRLGDSGDRTIIGNSASRYRYGLTLDAAYKGFDLQIFFQGVGKRDFMRNGYTFFGEGNGNFGSVVWKQHLDYYRPEGTTNPLGPNTDAYYARPYNWQNGKRNQVAQTRWLQNAAYLRLKNLQVGYTFPEKWIKKAKVQKLRVYFSGENLLTFTKLTDLFDPETLDSGFNGNAYPLGKVISAGLSVTF